MAQLTIPFSSTLAQSDVHFIVENDGNTDNLDHVEITPFFIDGGVEAYLTYILINTFQNSFRVYLAPVTNPTDRGQAADPQFSEEFLDGGIIRLDVGGETVDMVFGEGIRDLTEPIAHTFSGLTQDLQDRLEAWLVAANATGATSGTVVLDKEVPPPLAPENLEVESSTARNTAEITFETPDSQGSTLDSIDIEYQPVGSDTWTELHGLAADTVSRTLTNLAAGTTFNLRVRGISSETDGDGEWAEATFSTLPDNQPPTVVVHTENRAVAGQESVRLVAGVEDLDSIADPPVAPTVLWTASPNLGMIVEDDERETVYMAPTEEAFARTIVLTCTATDDEGATASDTVTIEVRSLSQIDVSYVADYSVKITRDGMPVQHMGSDLTSWLLPPVDWRQVREYGSAQFPRTSAGRANLKVINDDGEWDHIRTRDDVEIIMTVHGGSGPVWTGYVDKPEEKTDRQDRSILTLRCLGNMARLRRNKITIHGQPNVGTRSGMHQVFEAAGLPQRFWGDVDDTETIDWFYAQDELPLDVARRIEATARGVLREDRQGRIGLQSFQRRAETTVSGALNGYHKFEFSRAQEREYAAFEGILSSVRLGTERRLWGVNEQTGDFPITIAAGGRLSLFGAVPNPAAPSEIVAVNSVSSPDPYPRNLYNSTNVLDIVASAADTGVSVSVENPHEFPVTLRSLRVLGVAWEVTDGEVVRRANVPDATGLEHAEFPAHFISRRSKMIEAMNILLRLGIGGQQVHQLHWFAGNDYIRAQDLETSQIIPLQTRRATGNFVVEAMRHRLWRGGRHDVRVTLTDAGPYEGVFFSDISLADGPDKTP